jgi:hypothetical protein
MFEERYIAILLGENYSIVITFKTHQHKFSTISCFYYLNDISIIYVWTTVNVVTNISILKRIKYLFGLNLNYEIVKTNIIKL